MRISGVRLRHQASEVFQDISSDSDVILDEKHVELHCLIWKLFGFKLIKME